MFHINITIYDINNFIIENDKKSNYYFSKLDKNIILLIKNRLNDEYKVVFKFFNIELNNNDNLNYFALEFNDGKLFKYFKEDYRGYRGHFFELKEYYSEITIELIQHIIEKLKINCMDESIYY